MAVFVYMIDTIIVVAYIIFTLVLFMSMRTTVHNDDAQRFSMEMSDVIANSGLVESMNVFSIEKMNEAERKGLELYAKNCDFSFVVEVEQAEARMKCSGGESCRSFCTSVCGLENPEMSAFGTLTGNCGCNFELLGTNYCQCRKPEGIWQSGYYWKLGNTSFLADTVTKVTQEFPSAIATRDGNYEAALPAKLTVTAYDTLLTRTACIVMKSYETKETESISFGLLQIPVLPGDLTLGNKDGKICMYRENAEDCRQTDVPLAEDLNLVNVFDALAEKKSGIMTAYPLKGRATCDDVENSDSLSKPGDETPVESILLCVKAVG